MIEYLALVLAIPLGLGLARLTRDEKEIYSRVQYFPAILWGLAILAAVFLTLDRVIGLPLVFMFLTTLIWAKRT